MEDLFTELEKTFETLESKMREDFFNILSNTYNIDKVEIELKYPLDYKIFKVNTSEEEMRKTIEAESIYHITFYFNALGLIDEYNEREERGEDLDALDYFIFQYMLDELEKCKYFNPSAQNYYFNVNGKYV